ncbi:5-hydroxytryptamine receptor 2C-like [Rhopilema esculentum]|uniref:5-hydroxytryptamine receptor 2C-like n=1 Tax=Rhopilema esculentum TaxID=499914 RepID=UPI0031E18CC4|eukprot:gene312-9967_t
MPNNAIAESNWCKTAYPTQGNITALNAIILMAFNVAIALSNIFVNGFLIFALKRTDQLKSLSIKLIVCLSLSDCSVGLILQPIVLKILANEYYGINSCRIDLAGQAISFVFCHFSGVMLAIISLDRYIHIRHASRYSSYVTKSRAIALVLIDVAIALTVAAVSIIASLQQTYFIFDIFLSSFDTVVVIFIWLNYILMFHSIRKHTNSVLRQDNGGIPRISNKLRADAVVVKTMILLMTSQAICFFPYFIASSIWSYRVRNIKEAIDSKLALLLWWSLLLVFIYSSANGLIFIVRNPSIRRRYFRKFCKLQRPVAPQTNFSEKITLKSRKSN